MTGRPGVVFDVDGTLLDTNYLHTLAWTYALRRHGFDTVAMADVHRAIGIASEGLVPEVLGAAGVDEDEITDDLTQALTDAHAEAYEPFEDDIRAFPRAADLLRRLHDGGAAVVIATSGKKDDLDWMLPAIGVDEDLLAGAATSDDVEDAKPAPDLMHAAMTAADLDPEHTVAVGDTIWDVRAARDAGIRAVAFLSGGIGEAELRDEGAVEVWADAADLLEHLDESVLGEILRAARD